MPLIQRNNPGDDQMSFYLLDDLSYTRQQAKDDPNGKATYPWSDAYEINRVSGDCEYCPKCGRPTTLTSFKAALYTI